MERYKVFEDFVDDANSICLFQIIAVATMQKILVSTVYSGGSDANLCFLFWIIVVVCLGQNHLHVDLLVLLCLQ